jgi:hypothetical protein
VRAAEEAQKIRRHASWIAKQVAGFWKKAERVVNYKVCVGGMHGLKCLGWWGLPPVLVPVLAAGGENAGG